jgi:hypothetical protein
MLEVAEADLELDAGFCPCERRARHAGNRSPSLSTRTIGRSALRDGGVGRIARRQLHRAPPQPGDRGFESRSLQRRVSCEPRSREKLGRRCHDVDKRGQLRFRDSRRVFSPVSLRAGLVRLASAAIIPCALPCSRCRPRRRRQICCGRSHLPRGGRCAVRCACGAVCRRRRLRSRRSRSAWRSYSTELSFATRSCCAIAPIGNLIGSSRARARSRCERLG